MELNEKKNAPSLEAAGREEVSEVSNPSPMQAMVSILNDVSDFSRLKSRCTGDGWVSLVNIEKVLSQDRGTLRYRLRNIKGRVVIGLHGRSERQYRFAEVADVLGVKA